MMRRNKAAKDAPYDCIIVLGAQVRTADTPSEALKRRLTLALERYRERPVPIICCGAQGKNEPCTEGDFMCAWLAREGVPPAMLHAETASFDTLQNIEYARKIMRAEGYVKALVVTSDYHVPRALAICRRYQIPAEGAGSPSVRSYWLKNHARELLAWGKFFMYIWYRG